MDPITAAWAGLRWIPQSLHHHHKRSCQMKPSCARPPKPSCARPPKPMPGVVNSNWSPLQQPVVLDPLPSCRPLSVSPLETAQDRGDRLVDHLVADAVSVVGGPG